MISIVLLYVKVLFKNTEIVFLLNVTLLLNKMIIVTQERNSS